MKYLKTFETTIKHTDPISMNHTLRDFSRKVEDVMIEIKNIDGFSKKNNSSIDRKSLVRRYFNSDGTITINYTNIAYGRMLKIDFKITGFTDDQVKLRIYCYKKYSKDDINTSLEFYNYLKNIMNEYITKEDSVSLDFKFSLTELSNVLETLESFINAKKYNL